MTVKTEKLCEGNETINPNYALNYCVLTCKILVRSVQRKHSEAPGVTWGNRGTCNIGCQAIVSSGIL